MEKTHQKPVSSSLQKIKYLISFLAISIALGCISLVSSEADINLGWMKLLQMLCFCGVGILHTRRQYSLVLKNGGRGRFQFSVQLFLLIFVGLLILYYITYPKLILLALGSVCAFALPYIIERSWITVNAFSRIQFKIWTVPVPDTFEKTFIFFGGVPIRVIFSVDANDRNKKLFKSNAPLDKSIGDFYNHFLLIQRNNNRQEIALKDENQNPFGWKFFKVDMWGLRKKQLDPQTTFEEIDLKSHSTILAKRVRLAEDEDLNIDRQII